MVDRYTKLRVRRSLRRKQKTIEKAGEEAGDQFDRHVLRRWRNLKEVRRFVAGWLFLAIILGAGVLIQNNALGQYHETDVAVAGGEYREGVVGNITNLNPIYATDTADRAAAKLIFSTLLQYDKSGELVGDLAKNWSTNKDETIYTFKLKKTATWHDGEPVTADDVVFTYDLIQTPDSRSYLNSSWRDIKVQKVDDYTVTFALQNAFTPFPHSLTRGGIIPEHILGEVDASQLRGDEFNTLNPIGSGPYVFSSVVPVGNHQELTLDRFNQYHQGRPKIDRFVLYAYQDHELMIDAFKNGTVIGMSGLRSIDREQIEDFSGGAWSDVPLDDAVYLFFKTSKGTFKDPVVRKALTRATNTEAVYKQFSGRYIPVDSALLRGQLGYRDDIVQYPHALDRAKQDLDKAGWKVGKDGIRKKGKKTLELKLVTQNSDDYPEVARMLQQQWKKVGVRLKVNLISQEDMSQNTIVPHSYQLLLFGVSIGKDPDVYPYWHSSQAQVGALNLSEYDNPIADTALDAGRTRMSPRLRSAKYRTFLLQWAKDAPAVGLYQPSFGFMQYDNVEGFILTHLTAQEDRFNNVQDWTVNTKGGQQPY